MWISAFKNLMQKVLIARFALFLHDYLSVRILSPDGVVRMTSNQLWARYTKNP